MKYILSVLAIVIVSVGIVFFREDPKSKTQDYLRIHITANSNSQEDQNIKYFVKDAVVEYLIPLLSEAENKNEAQEIIFENILNIEKVVNKALEASGKTYGCQISLSNENVPMRAYDDLVLESGVYECLKIDIGKAQGDNWWCVVFPAVCFISSKNLENFEYISKIWEIINNVT